MSAHFCAAIPNFRIMEIDIDDVPWKDDLRHRAAAHRERPPDHAPKLGWGADVNEDVVKRHPPK
jgi:galactonate dehydratase